MDTPHMQHLGMMEERRKHPRVRLGSRGTIRAAGGSRVPVRLLDISVGGLCVSYSSPLKVGSQFEVELALCVRGVLAPMRLHGVIYQTHLSHDEFCSGMKFVDLKPECAKTIERFVKYRLNLR